MAYSTVWDNNRPAGSTAANHIDDEIRLVRAQIAERMSGLLVVDWTADPIVLLDSLAGGNNSFITIPPAGFIAHAPSEYPVYQNESALAPYFAILKAPISLPSGVSIRSITYLININTCTSVTCALIKTTFDAALTVTPLGDITTAIGGYQLLATPGLDAVIDETTTYYLQITAIGSGANTFNVGGAKILYSRT